jgi:hypothetical protein
LIRCRNLNEDQKTNNRDKLAGRIKLLHEVIQTGVQGLLKEQRDLEASNSAKTDAR